MNNDKTPSSQVDDEPVDLFDCVSELPAEVQDTLARYSKERDDEDLAVTVENLLNEIEALGYTFDYDLGYTPFNLQKMADNSESADATETNAEATLVMATFETPNFTFQVFGRDIEHCDKLLATAWHKHAMQYRISEGYLTEYYEDVCYREIKSGLAFRDGEALPLSTRI